MVGLLLIVLGLVLSTLTPAEISRWLDVLTFLPVGWGVIFIGYGAAAVGRGKRLSSGRNKGVKAGHE